MKTIKTRSPMEGSAKATVRNREAEHARHAAIIRKGLNTEVERLRESLGEWIKENTHRANDTAISIAMLETAFDRYVELLGESDAFDLIQSAFRRRAEMFRCSSTVTVAEFVRRGRRRNKRLTPFSASSGQSENLEFAAPGRVR
jgi:hypothetical protein